MMMTKLALAVGLYAHRSTTDAETERALRRSSVAAKAHTRAQQRFTTAVLDDIDAGQSGSRVEEAAAEAARVARKLGSAPAPAAHDPQSEADRVRSIFGAAFKR